MSKADEMGESTAFDRVGNPRSARGRSKDNAFNAAGPSELALHLLSRNPDNPREEIGDVTDLANSLRDHKQKQALAVMTRGAYLDANPGRESELEEHAQYVVIDGNRRLEAARQAGLKSLKVMLDDEGLGSSETEILESALVANVFNKQLEPLEEAKALKTLLDIHGTQESLAARLHRSQGWISQRLSLLNLTPELKARLAAGTESATHLRRVGNKKAEEQEEALAKLKAKEAVGREKKAKPAAATASTSEGGQPSGPPDPPSAPGPSSHSAPSFTAVKPDRRDSPDPVEPATEPETQPQEEAPGPQEDEGTGNFWDAVEEVRADWLPLQKPETLARMLQVRMSSSNFEQMVKVAQTLI